MCDTLLNIKLTVERVEVRSSELNFVANCNEQQVEVMEESGDGRLGAQGCSGGFGEEVDELPPFVYLFVLSLLFFFQRRVHHIQKGFSHSEQCGRARAGLGKHQVPRKASQCVIKGPMHICNLSLANTSETPENGPKRLTTNNTQK